VFQTPLESPCVVGDRSETAPTSQMGPRQNQPETTARRATGSQVVEGPISRNFVRVTTIGMDAVVGFAILFCVRREAARHCRSLGERMCAFAVPRLLRLPGATGSFGPVCDHFGPAACSSELRDGLGVCRADEVRRWRSGSEPCSLTVAARDVSPMQNLPTKCVVHLPSLSVCLATPILGTRLSTPSVSFDPARWCDG